MNLLLLSQRELLGAGRARIDANRYPPRSGLWPPAPGRRLRVGVRDAGIGTARVEQAGTGGIELSFALDAPPPPPLPLRLLLALPRPKMLRRVLQAAAELGIKQIFLVNAARVEKSYWQSPLLAPEALDRCLVAGLEQAVDTAMPAVALRPRLRPFVEDELPALAAGDRCVLAHPAVTYGSRPAGTGRLTLAIGPEGGFNDFERALFADAGFAPFSLGPRVLRVETALPALVATLLPAPP